MEGGASGSAAVTDSAMAEAGAVDPVRLTPYRLVRLFFQPEQYFSLTTIQPEQCFQPV